MAERWPKAGKYRDTFERLKQLVLGRETIEEKDDSIVLEPHTRVATEAELGATSGATINTDNDTLRHEGSPIHVLDAGPKKNNISTSSVIPNVIRSLVREPFPLWEGESFNLNFEALMPLGATFSNDLPWNGGHGLFDSSDPTPFNFTFSLTEFGQPSDYDFDPVTFDYPATTIHTNEYGGILDGLAGARSDTNLQ